MAIHPCLPGSHHQTIVAMSFVSPVGPFVGVADVTLLRGRQRGPRDDSTPTPSRLCHHRHPPALCKCPRDRGISLLGSLVSYTHGCEADCTLTRVLALQGAFVEHQAMFQKLSLKRRIHIVQVRTVDDLKKCDALVIPGGGEYARSSVVLYTQVVACLLRINDNRTARPIGRPFGTSTRLREVKACVGDVCGCDTSGAGGRRHEEGWAGVARWDVCHRHEEWVWVSGMLLCVCMVSAQRTAGINRLSLLRHHSPCKGSATPTNRFMEYSFVLLCVIIISPPPSSNTTF